MFNKDRERMLNFSDWKDEMLRSIKAPALIICGDRDVILSEHTVAMSKLIVDSRLMILPAEHGSYMGAAESPQAGNNVIELTMGIITDFLNK
jgi:pimeloyl-ACP methyl ester carboxylesterase